MAFYQWLGSLDAGHSGELLLNYSHNKGDFPSLSIDIEVVKSKATDALEKIEDSIRYKQVHVVYNTPFYLKPVSVTIHDDSNIVSIPLVFESIYAPRGDYNPLDYYINIRQDQQFSFASMVSAEGVSIQSGTASTIKARNDDKKERRKIRDLLVANAQATGSYVDYSQNFVRIVSNVAGVVHTLPDNFSILPEYTVTRNGMIGAPMVDGVRLANPWSYKGWLPDDSNLLVEDDENQSDEDTESMVEIRWIGEPDLEPKTPTKILDGVNYQYRSTEEADKFPLAAQNPNALVYPNGFKKSIRILCR